MGWISRMLIPSIIIQEAKYAGAIFYITGNGVSRKYYRDYLYLEASEKDIMYYMEKQKTIPKVDLIDKVTVIGRCIKTLSGLILDKDMTIALFSLDLDANTIVKLILSNDLPVNYSILLTLHNDINEIFVNITTFREMIICKYILNLGDYDNKCKDKVYKNFFVYRDDNVLLKKLLFDDYVITKENIKSIVGSFEHRREKLVCFQRIMGYTSSFANSYILKDIGELLANGRMPLDFRTVYDTHPDFHKRTTRTYQSSAQKAKNRAIWEAFKKNNITSTSASSKNAYNGSFNNFNKSQNAQKANPPKAKPKYKTAVMIYCEYLHLNHNKLNKLIVKKAYRKRVKETHPDRFATEQEYVQQQARKEFENVKKAYDYLIKFV